MDKKEALQQAFGKHLSQMRKEKGISIRQLAAASGLEYSQVQRIEQGKVNLAFSTLAALSQGMELELSALLKGFSMPG